jgi:sulfofructose kinase
MVIVKPNGQRSVINYRKKTPVLSSNYFNIDQCNPRVILFDGHEPNLSLALAKQADARRIPTVLDAGSVHLGTEKLIRQVDYLVVSEKFAHQYTSRRNREQALRALQRITDTVIITCGEDGLIWGKGGTYGTLPAFPVKAIDTNGAGDAFHGAFCAGLSQGMSWEDVLQYASVAAAGCCTRLGGRDGLPSQGEAMAMMKKFSSG